MTLQFPRGQSVEGLSTSCKLSDFLEKQPGAGLNVSSVCESKRGYGGKAKHWFFIDTLSQNFC